MPSEVRPSAALSEGARSTAEASVAIVLGPGSRLAPPAMATTFQLRCWTRFFASPSEVEAAFGGAPPKLGSFSRWEHSHEIEEGSAGVRYIETLTFTPSALPKLSALATERLFRRRHRAAAKGLKADPQVTGVSVLRVLVEEEAA